MITVRMNRTCQAPAAIAICYLALLTGCMTSAQTFKLAPGVPLDRSKIALIKAGVTTLSEVLDWFGPPDYIIDGTKRMLEPIPPPYFLFHPIETSVPTRVLTAPEGTVILVYAVREGQIDYSHLLVAPVVTGVKIAHDYHEQELYIYLSKKDRIVVEVLRGVKGKESK